MLSTKRDNTVRRYDTQVAVESGEDPDGIEAPHRTLTVVRDSAGLHPLVSDASRERSDRAINWLVGAALAILVAVLAAVMLNAGINVQVQP